MIKYRFIAIFLVIFSLFIGAPFVHADESNFLTAPFKLLVHTLETRKENKEANKNVRNEIIEKQKDINIQYLTEASARMENIAARLDSRIKKTENSGIDLTDAKAALKAARNKIMDAKEDAALMNTPNISEALSYDLQDFIDTALLNLGDARSSLERATKSVNNTLGN